MTSSLFCLSSRKSCGLQGMCVGLVVFLGCPLGTVGNKIGTKSLSLIQGTKFTTGQGEKAEAADFSHNTML